MNDNILTIPEVAKYLKISKSKVYILAQRNLIPSIKLGRNIRIKESDLDKWLEDTLNICSGKKKPGEPWKNAYPSFNRTTILNGRVMSNGKPIPFPNLSFG